MKYGIIEPHDLYDFNAPNAYKELVTCKDCRWQSVVTDDEEGTSYYMCGVWANATDEDVFCSYGERRADGQDIQSTDE